MKKILRPAKAKIIVHLLLSLCYILAIIFFPASGFSRIFSEFSFSKKMLCFSLSWLASFIIYYPLTFGIAYLASSIRNSVHNAKEIILALFFIAIFNPLTLYVVASSVLPKNAAAPDNIVIPNNIPENSGQTEPACGLRINDFTQGSKAQDAGIEKGDVIIKFNGAEMKSVQDIFSQLAKNKPGDKVSLETERGPKTVELIRNANDPNYPALGVKLEPSPCEKK